MRALDAAGKAQARVLRALAREQANAAAAGSSPGRTRSSGSRTGAQQQSGSSPSPVGRGDSGSVSPGSVGPRGGSPLGGGAGSPAASPPSKLRRGSGAAGGSGLRRQQGLSPGGLLGAGAGAGSASGLAGQSSPLVGAGDVPLQRAAGHAVDLADALEGWPVAVAASFAGKELGNRAALSTLQALVPSVGCQQILSLVPGLAHKLVSMGTSKGSGVGLGAEVLLELLVGARVESEKDAGLVPGHAVGSGRKISGWVYPIGAGFDVSEASGGGDGGGTGSGRGDGGLDDSAMTDEDFERVTDDYRSRLTRNDSVGVAVDPLAVLRSRQKKPAGAGSAGGSAAGLAGAGSPLSRLSGLRRAAGLPAKSSPMADGSGSRLGAAASTTGTLGASSGTEERSSSGGPSSATAAVPSSQEAGVPQNLGGLGSRLRPAGGGAPGSGGPSGSGGLLPGGRRALPRAGAAPEGSSLARVGGQAFDRLRRMHSITPVEDPRDAMKKKMKGKGKAPGPEAAAGVPGSGVSKPPQPVDQSSGRYRRKKARAKAREQAMEETDPAVLSAREAATAAWRDAWMEDVVGLLLAGSEGARFALSTEVLPPLFSMDPRAVQEVSIRLQGGGSGAGGFEALASPGRGGTGASSGGSALLAALPDISKARSGAGAAVDWGDGELEEDLWTELAERKEDDTPLHGGVTSAGRSPRQTRALLVVLRAAQSSKGEGQLKVGGRQGYLVLGAEQAGRLDAFIEAGNKALDDPIQCDASGLETPVDPMAVLGETLAAMGPGEAEAVRQRSAASSGGPLSGAADGTLATIPLSGFGRAAAATSSTEPASVLSFSEAAQCLMHPHLDIRVSTLKLLCDSLSIGDRPPAELIALVAVFLRASSKLPSSSRGTVDQALRSLSALVEVLLRTAQSARRTLAGFRALRSAL